MRKIVNISLVLKKDTMSKNTNQSTIITDLKDIISEQRNFYQQLYKARPTIESELNFLDTPITQLNNDEINICEHECTESLNDMGLNKSPGSDGITVEFYKAFWDILKMHHVKSVNFSFQNQSLTELQKQGLITLLPKSGKDLELLTNWRPISLLNIDYKIATKAIAI